MAIKAKQALYCVKFPRAGFLVRHSRNLTYKQASNTVSNLSNQGIAARIERQ
jgi:hypothetical protein